MVSAAPVSLVYFLFIFVGVFGVGSWTVRLLGVEGVLRARRDDGPLRLAVQMSFGVGVMSLLALGLLSIGFFPRVVSWTLMAAFFALGIVEILRAALPGGRPAFRSDWRSIAGWGFVAAGILLHAWLAWNPLLLFDSWAYHITMPKQYVLQGRIFATPYEMHPNLHFLHEFFLAWGLSVESDDFILAKLPQVAYLGMTAMVFVSESRRRFAPWAGFAAAFMLIITPDIVEFTASAHVDISVAFYILAGLVMAARGLDACARDRRAWFVLSGVSFGWAIGTKTSGLLYAATAGVLCAATMAWRVWKARSPRLGRRLPRRPIADLALMAAAMFLLLLPWMAKNLVITHAPLYPFDVELIPPAREYVQVARDFHRSYGNYQGFAPLSPSWLLSVCEQTVFALRNCLVVEQWQYLALFLVAALRWAGFERNRPRGECFLVFVGLVLFPLIVMTPARRFVFGAMFLQLFLGFGIVARAWTRVRSERPESALGRFAASRAGLATALLASACWLSWTGMRAVESIAPSFGPRGPIPPGTFLSVEAMHREYFRHREEWPLVEYLESTIGPSEKILTTENTYANALADVPIQIALNIHGQRILRLMAEDEGNSCAVILERLRGYGVTHVFTAMNFDNNSALEELRANHLEPMRADKFGTLYRIRYGD